MTTWFVSDTHFTHSRMLDFYPNTRPYKTTEEMDRALIVKWNEKVKPDDAVYHLGDVGFGEARLTAWILSQLNGTKFLVPGNHDRRFLKAPESRYVWAHIYPYSYAEIRHPLAPNQIVLSHFPIWEWNHISRSAWHLHGHCHGKPTGVPGKILDVGIDGPKYLWSIQDVAEFMATKPIRKHHD